MTIYKFLDKSLFVLSFPADHTTFCLTFTQTKNYVLSPTDMQTARPLRDAKSPTLSPRSVGHVTDRPGALNWARETTGGNAKGKGDCRHEPSVRVSAFRGRTRSSAWRTGKFATCTSFPVCPVQTLVPASLGLRGTKEGLFKNFQ